MRWAPWITQGNVSLSSSMTLTTSAKALSPCQTMRHHVVGTSESGGFTAAHSCSDELPYMHKHPRKGFCSTGLREERLPLPAMWVPRNPGFLMVDTLCLIPRAVSAFQLQGQERHCGRMECFVGVLGENGGDADLGRRKVKKNTI